MDKTGIAGLVIIAINVIVSIKGFGDRHFLETYMLHSNSVLQHKDYKRLITSGFIHANWPHLIFNMISLYFFSGPLEDNIGIPKFLIIYLASLISGNILALLFHRHHPDYRALGASGAISGIIFACIALMPGIRMGLLLIPVMVPGWVFGILYVAVSIYGIRSQLGNIGHEAHLGGAIIGMVMAIMLFPQIAMMNTLPIVAVLVPTVLFFIASYFYPQLLGQKAEAWRSTKYKKPNMTIDDVYNENRKSDEDELNRILEKIHSKGIDSLSTAEKDYLKKHSQNKD